MVSGYRALGLLVVLLLTHAGLAQTVGGMKRGTSLIPDYPISDHMVADFDGDGRDELVVFAKDGRVLSYHGTSGASLDPAPRGKLQLADPERSLIATGSFFEGAKKQLLVLSPGGLRVFRPDDRGDFSGKGHLLTSRARFNLRVGGPIRSNIVQDVNEDGRPDIVVPTPGFCELWLNQGPDESEEKDGLGLPRFRRVAKAAVRLNSQSSRGMSSLNKSLRSDFSIPNLTTKDVNGDGRLDLQIRQDDIRSWHLQREDGSIPGKPDVSLDLSIFRDTTPKSAIAPGQIASMGDRRSFESRDLDDDGILDYVIAHRRKIWIFHGTKAGPQFTKPSFILRSVEDVTALTLLHLDKDTRPDLLLIKVEVPSVTTFVLGFVSSWDLSFSAAGYRNTNGREFDKAPTWKKETALRFPPILSILKDPQALVQRIEYMGKKFRKQLGGDFDGDGKEDLALLSEDADRIDVFRSTGSADESDGDGDESLREILFEDKRSTWELEDVLLWMGGLAERRVAALTRGRNPDGSVALSDREKMEFTGFETGDFDGDGSAEIVLSYRPEGAVRVTLFDVMGVDPSQK